MPISRLNPKGYTSTGCTVNDCIHLPVVGSSNGFCVAHNVHTILQGAPRAIPIACTTRKPYTAACLAILRKRIKSRDPVVHATLEELRVFLKHRVERLQLTAWKGHKPIKKAHAMLWNIQGRYGEDSALVIMATIAGVLLCVKHEPGILQDDTYTSFQIMRALSSLMMSDGQQMVLPRKGGPGIWKAYKPKPSGRLLVGHLERLVIQPCRRLLTDLGTEFEADVLRRMLTHRPARAIRLPRKQPMKEATT